MKESPGDSRTTIPCDPNSYSEVCIGGGRVDCLVFLFSLYFSKYYMVLKIAAAYYLRTICRVKTKE